MRNNIDFGVLFRVATGELSWKLVCDLWVYDVSSSAVCLCGRRCEFLVYVAMPNGDHALAVVRKVFIKLSNPYHADFCYAGWLEWSKIGHRPAGTRSHDG